MRSQLRIACCGGPPHGDSGKKEEIDLNRSARILVNKNEMTTEKVGEGMQINKEVVKEALLENPNDIPSFKSMIQRAQEKEKRGSHPARIRRTAQHYPTARVRSTSVKKGRLNNRPGPNKVCHNYKQ